MMKKKKMRKLNSVMKIILSNKCIDNTCITYSNNLLINLLRVYVSLQLSS
mgnify:CR=1 FL=1